MIPNFDRQPTQAVEDLQSEVPFKLEIFLPRLVEFAALIIRRSFLDSFSDKVLKMSRNLRLLADRSNPDVCQISKSRFSCA